MSGEHIIRNETYSVIEADAINKNESRIIKSWSPARAAQEWARREDAERQSPKIAGEESAVVIVTGPRDYEARFRVTGR